MFLDVIKTLEIFIDPQNVQKLRESVGDRHLDLCTYRESKWPKTVFALNSGKSNEHEYVNIRKGERLRDIWLQYSVSDTDLSDKQEYHSWSDVQPSLGIPPEPYAGRQRNSFLRDLYIETYPQNGNVNGLAAGVLAIPNERNRAPTSVLLTNANGKLPSRTDDTLSEISRKTADLISYIPNVSRDEQSCIRDCTQPYGESCAKRFHNFKNADITSTNILLENKLNFKNPWLNDLPSQVHPQLLPLGIQNQNILTKINIPTLDLSITRSISDTVVPSSCINAKKYLSAVSLLHKSVNNNFRSYSIDQKYCENNNLVKAPIFNQVLDSPWCPRLPYNYRPFRRKLTNASDLSLLNKKVRLIDDFD